MDRDEVGRRAAPAHPDAVRDPVAVARPRSTSQTARDWLPRLAVFETLSIVVLFGNLTTVGLESVASLVGPVHGMAFVSTIACAWLARLSRRAKLLSIVPVLGGFLAVYVGRRDSARAARRAAERRRAPVSDSPAWPSESPARPVRPPAASTESPEAGSEAGLERLTAIEADGLVKRYGPQVQVGPLSFRVPEGSVTGLVGPNGVGKTTTIRMLLGLVRPDAGRLRMLGAEGDAIAGVLPEVGALIDGPALMPALSGRDNLQMLARLAGWGVEDVSQALATVGLSDRADAKVATYSLGMRQRLALAAALMGRPRLVILDEPANGLDPQGAAQLRSLLRGLADAGTTVVVSSHVLSEIEQICDHLLVLASHGIAFAGSRTELRARQETTLLLDTEDTEDTEDTGSTEGAGDDSGSRAGLVAVLERHGLHVTMTDQGPLRVLVPDTAPPGAPGARREGVPGTATGPGSEQHESRWAAQASRWAVESGIILTRLEVRRSSLEEVFFELTGDPGSSTDRLGDVAAAGSPAPVDDATDAGAR